MRGDPIRFVVECAGPYNTRIDTDSLVLAPRQEGGEAPGGRVFNVDETTGLMRNRRQSDCTRFCKPRVPWTALRTVCDPTLGGWCVAMCSTHTIHRALGHAKFTTAVCPKIKMFGIRLCV